jgi:hypothetical protein
MINTFVSAIHKLYPQVTNVRGEEAFDINGSKVEYDKAVVEAYVEANSYKGKRSAEYPAIVDQLDTIFHSGLDAWKEQIQAVKDKYPKA